jgi:hypothetical protein
LIGRGTNVALLPPQLVHIAARHIVPSEQDRINRAIREGVEYCCETGKTIPALARFTAELRNSGEWNAADTGTVEAGIRHILSGIVDGAVYPGDATAVLAPTRMTGPRPRSWSGI